MKKYSVIFFIKQSLNGLFMNSIMSITSIFILTSCLILTGCTALLLLNTNLNLEQLDTLNKIVFFIDRAYESDEEVARIMDEIRSLPNTDNIKLITKEENLEIWKAKYGASSGVLEDSELFDRVIKDNPLHDTIEIEYKNINDVSTLDYQLRSIKGMYKVNNQVKIAETIKNIKNIVMYVLFGFLIILFVIAVFIIINTVRLTVHSRKNEIIIMRYIGATNFFILFPFLLEGIIIGIVSSIIAFFIQAYIYGRAVAAIVNMESGLEFMAFSKINIMLFVAFLLTGVLCGFFGSLISSRKYLKA